MKNKSFIFSSLLLLIFINNSVIAQNTRIDDNNSIGWYTYTGTFKLSDKFGIHSEYQFRRDNIIKDWQQSLARVGINYQLHPKLQLRLGYAEIKTFPYGDYPVNPFGKDFNEHRIFEAATITDKISIVEFSHRFILEQRWLGKYSNANLSKADENVFANRLRYMFRMQLPLKGKSIDNKTPYAATYDELMMGFGKNVNENVFDQNRFGLLLGYKFNQHFKIEGGYLNQILQLGREVDTRNVFQQNNGIILNTIFNFDLSKKRQG